jgi:hypothetical protein
MFLKVWPWSWGPLTRPRGTNYYSGDRGVCVCHSYFSQEWGCPPEVTGLQLSFIKLGDKEICT